MSASTHNANSITGRLGGSALPCLLVLVALLTGCSDGSLKPIPVSGTVLVDGQPAAGAEVAFFGTDEHLMVAEAPFPRAIVAEDGTFTLSSFEPGDGAPAGDYRVTIVWKKSDSDDPEIRDMAPDELGGRYSAPETSGLTATVPSEPGKLPPFELTR